MWQLKLSRLTDQEMRVGEQIMAIWTRMDILPPLLKKLPGWKTFRRKDVETVLKKIQEFDPPELLQGIFRNACLSRSKC
jgi:RNA polymerase sigma-54 factor